MERRAVAGIPHSSDTKHRIVRRLGQPLPEIAFAQPTPDLPGLLCLNRPSEQAGQSLPLITKLVAYWTVIAKDPSLKKPCLEVLDQLSKSAAEDPTVLACLGAKALFDEKDNARAADYFTRALKLGSEDPSTFLDLGTALWRLGRAEQADKLLERGVAAYPYAPALRARLALQYLSEHRNQRARELIKDYMEVFPENSSMRDMLNKVEGLKR
jgi:tetratricopeptide (TPR) repeat protein